ncbi:SitI3 family protein [Paenibacillus kobensis]|uniref:SitI3 family protein n=1 Tax=Paenibacillus kobensis TaxID=59841 RepID=UPI000FD78875|nr:SitI3 family protein [Paenibacillus kobensis]
MAIEYSLKVDKEISRTFLLRELELMAGYGKITAMELPNGIRISDFEQEFGLTILLMEAGDYPYNAYDTQFIKDEFVYANTLTFRFINNAYKDETFEVVLALVFKLMRNTNSNALFLSNNDNELCFFTKDGIYIENSSHVWDKGWFAEALKENKYIIFDGNYIF